MGKVSNKDETGNWETVRTIAKNILFLFKLPLTIMSIMAFVGILSEQTNKKYQKKIDVKDWKENDFH